MLRGMKKGFTIIELLIVIVVIAMLAALVLNRVSGATENARDDQRKSDLADVADALDSYQIANRVYPSEANMEDSVWVSSNLAGLDEDSLADPQGVALNEEGGYTFSATPKDCDKNCTGYSISADLEEDGRGPQDSDENIADTVKQN